MDPLSDILTLLRPRSTLSVALDAGGDWAIAFQGHEGVKFNAVRRGACWVRVEGDAEPHRIEEGDCFLLTSGRPFVLATDLSVPPLEPAAVYGRKVNGVAVCNAGGDFLMLSGRFTFDGDHANVLFGAMPPVVTVGGTSANASVLRWALDQLADEVRQSRPGGALVAEHLAQLMLVQVLRLYLAQPQGTGGVGWLHAMGDAQIGRVLGAMHADPARRWTLGDLAAVAAMSRSAFAERFTRVVGKPPMDYLANWRMLVAGDRLRRTSDTIASIAHALGYESESAFSVAFKRRMLSSPRQYRRSETGVTP